jgi:prepilin-type N-terminal cleavage/methylation domain-containing protein
MNGSAAMIISGKKRSISSQAGFTMLEMLVAVTLVAMMAVGLWAVFRMSLRAWSRGTEFIDVNQRYRSILDLARKQIASAYPLITPPPSRAETQEPERPHLIFSGDSSAFRFVSLNSLLFQESPGLTLVSYEVVQDSKGEYTLVEREVPYTGQYAEQEALASQTKTTPIFENLLTCTFDYFDPNDRESPSPWKREWNGGELGRLPMAIGMTMTSRDSQGNSLSRHMVVPIQSETGTNLYNPMDPFSTGRAVIR